MEPVQHSEPVLRTKTSEMAEDTFSQAQLHCNTPTLELDGTKPCTFIRIATSLQIDLMFWNMCRVHSAMRLQDFFLR